MKRLSAEIEYLRELIEDFAAKISPDEASRALDIIAARYQTLEQACRIYPKLIDVYDWPEPERISVLRERISILHKYLFDEILSNAGEFRKGSDPQSGYIGFGGTKYQRRKVKFDGSTPSRIEDDLDVALAYLNAKSKKPVESALRFYQHFVFTHPFYDANGRLGRVIVSTYLIRFNYYVRWGEFDGANNGKFIKKLNECHKRMERGYQFEKYFSYLLDFFNRYVITIDELGDFE